MGCEHCDSKEPCMALHVDASGNMSVVCRHTREPFRGLVPFNLSAAFCDRESKVAKVASFWLPVVVDTDTPFEIHGGLIHEPQRPLRDLVGGLPDDAVAGGDGE